MRGCKHEEGGFSLLEIAIGVLIVGTLCAISVPGFLNQRKVAADAELEVAMHYANTFEIGIYKSDHAGKAPASLATAGYHKPNPMMMISIVSNGLDYCLYGYVEGSDEHTRETPYITYKTAPVDVCPISGTPVYE